MIKRHRKILLLLFSALFLRIIIVVLAVQFREHPDILRWKDWGRIAFLYGFADTYTSTHLSFGTYPNNMPPGTLYIVSAMYWAWIQFGKILALFGIAPGSNTWVNVVLLRIFLQIPSILADLGIGYIVYRIAGVLAASLFLFNPVIFFNSSFWGQMDAINNLFAILALWLLLQKKYVVSFGSLVISLFVKFSLVFFVPLVFVIALWKRRCCVRTFLWSVGIAVVFLLLFVLPISSSPFIWFWQYVFHNATGEMTNVTAFAFNFWWVIFHPHLLFGPSTDLTKVVNIWLSGSPLTQKTVGPVSLGMITGVIAVFMQIPVYLKLKINNVSIISAFASLAILSFLFFPQMHERYLYPAFAPLAILLGFGIPIFWEFVTLSLVNFVNLLCVWHPMPLPIWLFDMLKNSDVQWWTALVTTGMGVWTVWKLTYWTHKP